MSGKSKFMRLLFGSMYCGAAFLVLRVSAGLLIINHGLQKAENFDKLATTFFDPIGIGSQPSLILSMAAELGAAAFIIAGLLTRPAAFVLVVNMAVAAFMAHHPFKLSESEMPLLYLLIFLVICIHGAGRYSLDNMIMQRNAIMAKK